MRSQILEKYPELRPVLAELGGKISEEDMRKLNYQVDGEQQEAGQVARQFLQQKLGGSQPVPSAK